MFKVVEHELHMIGNQDVYCSLLSDDVYYSSNSKPPIKRFYLSNTIDERFFKEIENIFLPNNNQKKNGNNGGVRMKIMRDPFEFINFFKQIVYHQIDEPYDDFQEDIKLLKENHILIKGHERTSGKNFINIGKKFK